MEQLLGFLLPFGNVSVAVVGLLILTLILSLIYELVLNGIYFGLAFDAEDAPEFTMTNPVCKFLDKITPTLKPEDLVVPHYGGYYVKSGAGTFFSKDTTYRNWSCEEHIRRHALYEDREDAIASATRVLKENLIRNNSLDTKGLKVLLGFLLLDTLILSLQHFFFPTVIISGMVLFVYGLRTLAKKVYKNSKRTNVHEERITKLEEGEE